jgi:hypothetical protein
MAPYKEVAAEFWGVSDGFACHHPDGRPRFVDLNSINRSEKLVDGHDVNFGWRSGFFTKSRGRPDVCSFFLSTNFPFRPALLSLPTGGRAVPKAGEAPEIKVSEAESVAELLEPFRSRSSGLYQ